MIPWALRLQRRLKELDWSVPELARRMGQHEQRGFVDRLYKIVRGDVENPRGTLMSDIAKAIGLTEEGLRYGQEKARRRNGSRAVARHIESSEIASGVEPGLPAPDRGLMIPELAARAGLGGGGFAEDEVRYDGQHADPVKPEGWQFPTTFVQQDLRAATGSLLIIEGEGDSMFPTIASGERLIVNTRHREPSPDGIYAIRDTFGGIIAKRLQVLRASNPPRIRIISDNPNHVAEEVAIDDIEIVGRVIWGLKRF